MKKDVVCDDDEGLVCSKETACGNKREKGSSCSFVSSQSGLNVKKMSE